MNEHFDKSICVIPVSYVCHTTKFSRNIQPLQKTKPLENTGFSRGSNNRFLSLGELWRSPGGLEAVFFPLFHPRITG